MKLLVCGGAGFIGSTFVRQRVREHGDEVVVLDKLTYAGRQENLAGPRRRIAFVHAARSRTADAVARGDRGRATRSSTSPPRRTSTARSPSPTRSSRTHALGTYVLLEAARERGRALRAGLDRRGLRLDRGGLVHRDVAAAARPRPTARRRRARDLLVRRYFHTYGIETRDLPRLEQLRAVPVPGEADPADGAQRAARRHAARLRRRHAGAQLALRGGLRARRSATSLEHGVPGEVYNVGGPDEAPNIDVVKRILELTGSDESLIEYVTDRPGHDRRYSLSLGEGARARLGAAGALRRGPASRPSPGTATTTWWWEPIRSGDYREYYERQYGKTLG